MSGFSKLSERLVFRGALVSVAEATFYGPDGKTFTRDVVHHPGAVDVVPVLEDGEGGYTVVMVRQYRAAADRELLEIPAGKRDVTGEAVEVTAARELEEEIGMRAGRLELLGRFLNSPGFSDEESFLFLAQDLTPCTSSAQGVEEQHMTIERIPLADVPGLVARGELLDAKSIIGLLLAREKLGVTPPR
ncbi:MAG: NUDIX hydrolase [Actinomycetota bacterium]|nr:NUDIX hydrolase [Actinomycetota bacterium]